MKGNFAVCSQGGKFIGEAKSDDRMLDWEAKLDDRMTDWEDDGMTGCS